MIRRVAGICKLVTRLKHRGRRELVVYHDNEYSMCLIIAGLTGNPELAKLCINYLYRRS